MPNQQSPAELPYRTSVWSAPEQEVPLSAMQLQGDLRVDVAVVGGGIVGLSAAYHLKKREPALRIALLEARYIGFGASGRNFGVVTPTVADWTGEWVDEVGYERGQVLVRFLRSCIPELRRLVEVESVECGLKDSPLAFVAFDSRAGNLMPQTIERLRTLGHPIRELAPAELEDLLGFQAVAGYALEDHALVQPFLLCRGLGAVIRELGVHVYEGATVAQITSGSPVVLKTESGRVIADHCVLALNAYSGQFPFLERFEFPAHSYVLATEPISERGLAKLGRFNDVTVMDYLGSARRSSFYQRFTSEGQLLLGGGGGVPGGAGGRLAPDRYENAYRELHAEIVRRYPSLREIRLQAAWGGPICVTRGHLPIVGPLPDQEGIIVAIVCNGRGMCMGSNVGRLITPLIVGPDAADEAALSVLPLISPTAAQAAGESGRDMVLARYNWGN